MWSHVTRTTQFGLVHRQTHKVSEWGESLIFLWPCHEAKAEAWSNVFIFVLPLLHFFHSYADDVTKHNFLYPPVLDSSVNQFYDALQQISLYMTANFLTLLKLHSIHELAKYVPIRLSALTPVAIFDKHTTSPICSNLPILIFSLYSPITLIFKQPIPSPSPVSHFAL